MTLMEEASRGRVPREIEAVASREGIEPAKLARLVAAGRVVIPGNLRRVGLEPAGIGERLTTKVNVNVGTSQNLDSPENEVEKAMAANGGKKPTHEQLAAALTGLEWDSPAGRIRMALGEGHQAVQDTAIGKTRYDAAKKLVMIDDIQRFPADCVNPPANMKSEEWIKAGFPGAKCP